MHQEIENNPAFLREKAIKALAKVKDMEAKALKEGATYKRIDRKTLVLVKP
ncbi:hypothetical protein [Formosa sp. S-31]|uniref:hypothetical protein n=1 Tax=Formosa sp. S-31 TaxID=2790949 RepID=UPI003EBB0E63